MMNYNEIKNEKKVSNPNNSPNFVKDLDGEYGEYRFSNVFYR